MKSVKSEVRIKVTDEDGFSWVETAIVPGSNEKEAREFVAGGLGSIHPSSKIEVTEYRGITEEEGRLGA